MIFDVMEKALKIINEEKDGLNTAQLNMIEDRLIDVFSMEGDMVRKFFVISKKLDKVMGLELFE